MKNSILIAYLNAVASSNLDYESGSNGEINRQKALLKHSEVEFYSPTEFALAFNDEFISDLGFIAIVDSETKELILP